MPSLTIWNVLKPMRYMILNWVSSLWWHVCVYRLLHLASFLCLFPFLNWTACKLCLFDISTNIWVRAKQIIVIGNKGGFGSTWPYPTSYWTNLRPSLPYWLVLTIKFASYLQITHPNMYPTCSYLLLFSKWLNNFLISLKNICI